MENKLLKIITNESTALTIKNIIRLIFVYKYAVKNKLVTPSEDGAIYIAENQIENTFLRLVVDSKKDELFDGEIKQYCFVTRFNHKNKLEKKLKVNDSYHEMRKTKTGYLSYKQYMNLNGIFENMESWKEYIKEKGKENDNTTK
jgi:hypothetical protein